MQGFFLPGKIGEHFTDKPVVTLRILVNGIISRNNNLIKYIFVYFLKMQPVHYSQVLEYLVQVLAFVQTAEVMNTGIKNHFIPYIDLQATPDLLVFFKHTNLLKISI